MFRTRRSAKRKTGTHTSCFIEFLTHLLLRYSLKVPKVPFNVQCPQCSSFVQTTTSFQVGGLTWIIFVVLLILFWPLCWLPFVMKSCKDVVHTCPGCGARIGRFSRLSH